MCDLGNARLRVTVTESSDGYVAGLVTDVLFDPLFDVRVGMTIGGGHDGELACGRVQALRVGDSVLFIYSPGGQDVARCPEYLACSAERCGPRPCPGTEADATWDTCDSGCLLESREACAVHAEAGWLHGDVQVAVPQGDDWLFGEEQNGGDILLREAELGVLSDADACEVRFPPVLSPIRHTEEADLADDGTEVAKRPSPEASLPNPEPPICAR
jgi:hypothetical protein